MLAEALKIVAKYTVMEESKGAEPPALSKKMKLKRLAIQSLSGKIPKKSDIEI